MCWLYCWFHSFTEASSVYSFYWASVKDKKEYYEKNKEKFKECAEE